MRSAWRWAAGGSAVSSGGWSSLPPATPVSHRGQGRGLLSVDGTQNGNRELGEVVQHFAPAWFVLHGGISTSVSDRRSRLVT